MGFILTICVILFVTTTLPLSSLFEVSEFWSIAAALTINLSVSTVLFLLYNIQDYLKQLVENKSE